MAGSLRRIQLRRSLARLARVLRGGGQPDPRLIHNLHHGWGNESWSASTSLLAATLDWFMRSEGAALECGTGLTTLALAAAASASDRRVLSLEHNTEWAQRVQNALPPAVRSSVTVAHTPIRSYGSFDWYSLEACALPPAIGFVLCDGPPGSTRGGRYGLAPVLRSHLAPDCILLLDDTNRPEEHSIVQRWCAELDARVIHETSTYTVLRLGSAQARRAVPGDSTADAGARQPPTRSALGTILG